MKKIYLILTLYLFCTFFLYSKERFFIHSYEFQNEMNQNVEPFLFERCENGYFEGKNKANIYYEKYEKKIYIKLLSYPMVLLNI